MSPAVTIVILNWNGIKFLRDFLPSVMATKYDNFKVLVVDNASSDDSINFLKENYPSVETLVLDRNYGFTTGNNKALPLITSPYFVLLNNDVEVDSEWLTPLVQMMEDDEKVASVQPKLLSWREKEYFEYAGAAGGYLDVLGYPFCRGRIFDHPEKDEGQFEERKEIFWATGACCLIRKSVTDKIGLFEDRLFAHQEEIDFCWRSRNHGYKIMYEPKSKVFHVGGGTLKKVNPRKTFLNVRNSLSIMVLNLPFFQMIYKTFFRMCLDGVWGVYALTKGEINTIFAILKGHVAFYLRLPFLLKRRRQRNKGIDKITFGGEGFYGKSLVYQHFVKGLKFFSELKINS